MPALLTCFCRPLLLAAAAALVVSTSGRITTAQEPRARGWPQWGGPTRNFHADTPRLATGWPEGGPRQRWRRPLGEGYSSILVDGNSLVTMYRRGDNETIIAMDAATGNTRWEHTYAAPLTHNGYFDVWLNASGPGPYSTPLIADNLVFAVGVTGRFHVLDLATGGVRWSHDLVALFDLRDYNAFASSPLAYRDQVILPLGGSGQGVVAFTRATGKVAWRSDPIALAPGSPVLIDVDGRQELVIWTTKGIAGLDPDGGRLLWQHAHEAQMGLNISTPVWEPGQPLFISSAYGGGSRMIRLARRGGRTQPEDLWFNNRMRLHFGSAVRVDNLVIGSSGDFGPAFIVALDAGSGEEVWRDRTFARAQLLKASGMLVIVDESGDLALASASASGLQVHARAQLLTSNAWTPPTLVGTSLYVRDRKDLIALELSQ